MRLFRPRAGRSLAARTYPRGRSPGDQPGPPVRIDNKANDIDPWIDVDRWIAWGQAGLLVFRLDQMALLRERRPDFHREAIAGDERAVRQTRQLAASWLQHAVRSKLVGTGHPASNFFMPTVR